MDKKNTNKGRRELLRALTVAGGAAAAASALPEKWTRPVIDRVEIPAHAQASGPSTTLSFAAPLPGAQFYQGERRSFTVATTPPVAGLTIEVRSRYTVFIGSEHPSAIYIDDWSGQTNADGTFTGWFRVLAPYPTQSASVLITATAGTRSASVEVTVSAVQGDAAGATRAAPRADH